MAKTPIGSDFDTWLDDEGLLEDAEAVAAKRVIAWQLAEFMKEKHYTKSAMSKKMDTSRAQLDRLLDPQSTAVTLKTLSRAAEVMGRKLMVRFV